MAAATTFIFDASPLIASCQFAVGERSVADIALSGVTVQIPPAVYEEVITRGGTRPDALKAARLINDDRIQLADATAVGEELIDLRHYQLGRGEKEALTLTTRIGDDAVMVTDDFLALIVANRLGLSCRLFLDFVVGRAMCGELNAADAQQIIQAAPHATLWDSSRIRSRC